MQNIQENWRDNAASIIEAARLIAQQRKALPRSEYRKWLANQPIGNYSTAQKLANIAHHPVISNPANFAKLPPHWGKLYEASFLPDTFLQDKINNGGIEHLTRFDIYEIRGRKGRNNKEMQRGSRGGVLVPPQFRSLSEWTRAGIAKEAGGMTPFKVSAAIGMREDTYAKARTVVMLHDRDDLNATDRKIANAALFEMDTRRSVLAPYRAIHAIVGKIYGSHGYRGTRIKDEKRRKEDFARAMTVIYDTCVNAVDIKIPFMGEKESGAAASRLFEAIQALSDLAKKIRSREDG